MFSHQERVWAQLRQWERGATTLSPSGQRLRQTLRKLPKARPRRAANVVARMRIMRELSIRGESQVPKSEAPGPPAGLGGLSLSNPMSQKRDMGHPALALGPAAQTDVEEAAEGEA